MFYYNIILIDNKVEPITSFFTRITDGIPKISNGDLFQILIPGKNYYIYSNMDITEFISYINKNKSFIEKIDDEYSKLISMREKLIGHPDDEIMKFRTNVSEPFFRRQESEIMSMYTNYNKITTPPKMSLLKDINFIYNSDSGSCDCSDIGDIVLRESSFDITDLSANIKQSEYCGLENCGNTCYLNSLLQLLYSMELFRNYFINLKNPHNICCCALKIIFTIMYTQNPKYTKDKIIDISNIKINNIPINKILINSTGLNLGVQEDVQQFMSELIVILNNPIQLFPYLFSFNSINVIKCAGGDKIFPTGEMINYALNVYVKEGIDNMQDLLNINYKIESDASDIDICGTTYSGNKKMELKQHILNIPDCNKYIIIHLHRYIDDKQQPPLKDSKGNIIIENGEKKYHQIKSNETVTPNPIINIRGVQYKLTGTVIHIGTRDGGHYVFGKYDDDGIISFIIDDNKIDNQSRYRFIINQEANVFLYRRIPDKIDEPIKLLVDEPHKIYKFKDLCTSKGFMFSNIISDQATEERNKYLKYKNKYLKLKKII
jgi:ubiquitin C-terminal hydrolase